MKCFAGLLLTVISLPLHAAAYYTATSGSWSAPATWINAQVPALSGSDSIFIGHHVMYSASINLISSTYLRIDTGASLCGHRRFFVQAGSVLDNFGDLFADSLIIPGGNVTNYSYMLLTNMAAVSNGGSFTNNGSMQVGGSFLCSEKPQAIAETGIGGAIAFYPNPTRNGQKTVVKGLNYSAIQSLMLFSATGLFVEELEISVAGTFLPEGLRAGVYMVRLMENGRVVATGKLVIVE